MTRRGVLQLLAGLGTAAGALFLSASAAHAANPNPSPTVPVAVPVAPPEAVVAPVVDALRDAPIVGPILTKAGEPTPAGPPSPLPIVTKVLAPLASAVPSSSARTTIEAAASQPASVPVPAAFSRWRARAGTRVVLRVAPPARTSNPSPRSRVPNDSVTRSGLRGVPSGFTADGSTTSRGDASVATINPVAPVATAGWRWFDITSSRAPRPGVARDLSPPG